MIDTYYLLKKRDYKVGTYLLIYNLVNYVTVQF